MINLSNKEFCRECIRFRNKMEMLIIHPQYEWLLCPWCGDRCADEEDRMSWDEVHEHHLNIEKKQKELAKQLVTWM